MSRQEGALCLYEEERCFCTHILERLVDSTVCKDTALSVYTASVNFTCLFTFVTRTIYTTCIGKTTTPQNVINMCARVKPCPANSHLESVKLSFAFDYVAAALDPSAAIKIDIYRPFLDNTCCIEFHGKVPSKHFTVSQYPDLIMTFKCSRLWIWDTLYTISCRAVAGPHFRQQQPV